MDDDLLTMLGKMYDPILWLVNNQVGDNLFRGTTEVIKEIFILNPNLALYENINLDDL